MRLRSSLLNTIVLAANLTLNSNVWSTKGGLIYHNDTTPYIIRGTNWHGIESDCSVPHGLWANSMDFYLDLLKENGFNSIRTPVSYEVMNDLSTPVLDSCLSADAQYKGYTVGDFIDVYLTEAKKRDMTVLVDQHTILGKIQDYPWVNFVKEDDTINAWIKFLKRFGNRIFAIELKNEPHNACTLNEFFEWCILAIKRIEEETEFKGLYFISGVQLSSLDGNMNHAWGGTYNDLLHDSSIMEKFTVPISRLVFCPHVYGTSVRSDSVINDGESVWNSDFGFIKSKDWKYNQIPIIFTEMGGFLVGTDSTFYERFKEYAHNSGITAGMYWWSLPSTSIDTGGLIENDFKTIDWNKMNFVKSFVPNPTYSIS